MQFLGEVPNSSVFPRSSAMWRYLNYLTCHSKIQFIIKQYVKLCYSILRYNKYSLIIV